MTLIEIAVLGLLGAAIGGVIGAVCAFSTGQPFGQDILRGTALGCFAIPIALVAVLTPISALRSRRAKADAKKEMGRIE